MKTNGGIKTSYNAQACVDDHCQVIIGAKVTNQPNDREQLIPMLDQAQENTGGGIGIVTADAGYGNATNLEALEPYNVEAYIPDDTYQSRLRGSPVGPFDKEHFVYDPTDDVYICPEGNVLTFWYTKGENHGVYRVYRYAKCSECSQFGPCTKSSRGRSIWRRQTDEKVAAMRAKLDTDGGRQIYAKRKQIVEPVFGQIKDAVGFTTFHLRGLSKVNLEFMIVSIAHNLRKIARYRYKKGIGLFPEPAVQATG